MVYWHVEWSVITSSEPTRNYWLIALPWWFTDMWSSLWSPPPPQNPHVITDSLHFPDSLLTCGLVCDHPLEPTHNYWLIALPWWFTDMWSGLWSHPRALAYLLTHCTSLTVYWHVEWSVITPQNPHVITDSLHFPDGLLTCGSVCDHPPEPTHNYWLIALPWWFTDMWIGLWSPPRTHT